MKILILLETGFDIQKEILNTFLLTNCKSLKFTVCEMQFEIQQPILSKPTSFDAIFQKHSLLFSDFDKIFCFTNKQYSDNYFFHEHKNLSIFSFAYWEHLTDLPISNGVIYFISDYLALDLDLSEFRHQTTTGCIYDFLGDKRGIDLGMRQAGLCPNCLKRISEMIIDDESNGIFEDIKTLINLLSSSSKWNKDIFESVKVNMSKGLKQRKLKSRTGVNIVIASPGDTQQERQLLLNTLERRFRVENYETSCGHRIMVNGWEDLAAQNGYPQDIINDTIIKDADFVIAIFKHKLGSPTYDQDSGKQREESGTVEELLQAIDNSILTNPIGMAYFYSTAPVISLDTPNFEKIAEEWKKLNQFKNSISSKFIYKPYTEPAELLNMVLKDLGQNITKYIAK